MSYGNEVFKKQVGYYHPAYGCETADMDPDEKCDALLELINYLVWRISELEEKQSKNTGG